MDSQNVSWREVEKLVKILSKKIIDLNRDFTSISTISRGGLVPARLLADHLGIETIFVDKNKIPYDSIFVDDIYDSGKTFKKIIPKIEDPSKLVFVTLFARRGKRYPNQLLFAKKTIGTEYIVYPWDKLEFKRLKKVGL
ncbi:phosphoribosyltransferase [Nitrosopumilus sp. K4]|uniref:phosphoribosyltransferase n=1 Tax=Nitrosopumilus sp. K4 TaxID=2795383 RepID=UPI001BAB7FCE|nr:phosphoribosyltransferase [Nitrosopumilus sp. K4]QUC65208.1 phosphoribosyltransferase [Nitrosopumilus sp. K4]